MLCQETATDSLTQGLKARMGDACMPACVFYDAFTDQTEDQHLTLVMVGDSGLKQLLTVDNSNIRYTVFAYINVVHLL